MGTPSHSLQTRRLRQWVQEPPFRPHETAQNLFQRCPNPQEYTGNKPVFSTPFAPPRPPKNGWRRDTLGSLLKNVTPLPLTSFSPPPSSVAAAEGGNTQPSPLLPSSTQHSSNIRRRKSYQRAGGFRCEIVQLSLTFILGGSAKGLPSLTKQKHPNNPEK